MLLQNIARLHTKMAVRMSSGDSYLGTFITHTFPFAMFVISDGRKIYIQVDQISSIYIPEENNGPSPNPPTEEG